MAALGTESDPLRVAIIGAGPTGFFAAAQLLDSPALTVAVDLYDRLPTPFGLVRGGVAPDHFKIKGVAAVFARTAQHPRFRFFGHVRFGQDVGLDDLTQHYHQILFTTGAQTDRRMNVPGEDLAGSHAATEFVSWYNGHPDCADQTFDLSGRHAVVVGVGNVAIDVARILLADADTLAKTDIADGALEALRSSRIRTVTLLGRRGPAQAAYTAPEIKELLELPGIDIEIRPEELALDALTEADLAAAPSRAVESKMGPLRAAAARTPSGAERRLILRFLVSPTSLEGDDAGHVRHVHIVRNVLQRADDGQLKAAATDQTERLPADLVFRSVGYRGVPLPGIPFNERHGTILNHEGRVIDAETHAPIVGLYVAGWIKRGPSGVIGSNKPDAAETVGHMIADAGAGRMLSPADPRPESVDALIRTRQPDVFGWPDWLQVDTLEVEAGQPHGRPRRKLSTLPGLLKAAGKGT